MANLCDICNSIVKNEKKGKKKLIRTTLLLVEEYIKDKKDLKVLIDGNIHQDEGGFDLTKLDLCQNCSKKIKKWAKYRGKALDNSLKEVKRLYNLSS